MHYNPASDQVVSKVLDGEAIVIDLTTGIYYSLEGIAAKLWQECCSGTPLGTLIALAQTAYPDQTSVETDIPAFLDKLVADGLLARTGNAPKTSEKIEAVDWPATYVTPLIQSFDDVAEMVALDPPLPELQRYSTDS